MSIRDLTPWSWRRPPSNPEDDYHPIQALHERIDRLFDDILTGFDHAPPSRSTSNGAFLAPRIDISEGHTAYSFSAELPGVEEKDVEVTLSDGVLTIKGEKKIETSEANDHYLRTERGHGAFRRSFSLPPDIDEEKVKASIDKGVLTVTVARISSAKTASKRIEVKKAA